MMSTKTSTTAASLMEHIMNHDEMQIRYWAHMLDESSHISYYSMYMAEHPEDKQDVLAGSLIA